MAHTPTATRVTLPAEKRIEMYESAIRALNELIMLEDDGSWPNAKLTASGEEIERRKVNLITQARNHIALAADGYNITK